ncbi:MAG TPA: hypothetical protein VEV19_00055 [Ktedonobacteraceae bacterium]|nr:hypothetical protein [Ktedonobacteraceae bacterium]
MTNDEEIEQLRADNQILYGALPSKDEELEQAQQACPHPPASWIAHRLARTSRRPGEDPFHLKG